MTPGEQLAHLESQTRVLENMVAHTDAARFTDHPIPGKWSALEQLAHLARYHEVFLERLDAMLRSPGTPLWRYSAENDPEWAGWQAMPLEAVWSAFQERRARLRQRLEVTSEPEYRVTGIHPLLGTITLHDMLEMFLLHEGHHLYAVFQALRATRQTM
jgi:DinB superfamily